MKWSCTLQWYLCFVGVEDSHIDSMSLLQLVMWSPILSLVKTNEYHLNSILHPYEMNTTYDQMHFLVVVDLLHLLIFTCMRLLFGKPLGISSLALFWVLLALLDQSFWLLQLSISNVPRITTSMLAFQVPHLVFLLIGGNPLH